MIPERQDPALDPDAGRPVDALAMARDDLLVERIRAGVRYPAGMGDQVAARLAAWRAEVLAAPMPDWAS